MRAGLVLPLVCAAALAASCQAFLPPLPQAHGLVSSTGSRSRLSQQHGRPDGLGFVTALRAVDEDVEEITKKYGLEAGLFSIFKSKGAGEGGGQGKALQAKDLLAKYGSAYLITSISLSLVSFGLCYALVSAGVDVPSLLGKVGIQATGQAETAGTVALAYAAHKAASPIRFPPTVALTPFVANAIGKKPVEDEASE